MIPSSTPPLVVIRSPRDLKLLIISNRSLQRLNADRLLLSLIPDLPSGPVRDDWLVDRCLVRQYYEDALGHKLCFMGGVQIYDPTGCIAPFLGHL